MGKEYRPEKCCGCGMHSVCYWCNYCEVCEEGACQCYKATAVNSTGKPKIIASRLSGRCANGAGLDSGVRYHARIVKDGLPDETAVCGATYGKRSGGWSLHGAENDVNCPRCVKKLERMGEYEKVSRD